MDEESERKANELEEELHKKQQQSEEKTTCQLCMSGEIQMNCDVCRIDQV